MIYFIAYIVLMFVFAGMFFEYDSSEKDYWLPQAFFWPLTLLFFIGRRMGEILK